MPVSGLDWKFQVKDLSRLFRRWGSHSTNIRGVFNGILPVQIVDRWRDDEEGSIYGIYAETEGTVATIGDHPAIVMGSLDERVEVELLGFQVWYRWISTPPVLLNPIIHLFTPNTAVYNPVEYLSPVGVWKPGLVLNYGFDQPSAFMLTGYSNLMPTYPSWAGYMLSRNTRLNQVGSYVYPGADQAGSWDMVRPIRIPPMGALAWQMENPVVSDRLELWVSALFRERRYAG
jgi:hypothetical protein